MMFYSCVDNSVEKDIKQPNNKTESKKQLLPSEKLIEPLATIEDKKTFPNGIKIQWFKKGKGPRVEDGEVYEINFKVKLTSGETIDGNYKLQRKSFPFLVGYGMQTTGFDIALKELNEGDFAEIFIPGNLARGERGIPGIVPPNAPNIVHIRIGKKVKPIKTVEGVKVWRLEHNAEVKDATVTENSNVAINYFVGTKTNPRYDNSYQRNTPFAFGMKDVSLLPGLKKAMLGMNMFDKLFILVPANQAYGSKGYLDLVKPNESIFFDVFVMDVDKKSVKY
jgi:FKBP-type peptidyl-prolyl cis-trans isomerase